MRALCEAATPDDRNLSVRLSHGGIFDTATRAYSPCDACASIPVDFVSTTIRIAFCRGDKVEQISNDSSGTQTTMPFTETMAEYEKMTEKEKMLAGELYDCGDRELLSAWHKAKNLIRDYNALDSDNAEEKDRILTELLGGKGKNLWITAPFYVDYGMNIFFGNNCEVNMNCTFLDDNKITIGDNALISPNVQIYTAYHPFDAKERFGAPKEDGTFEFCKTQTAPVTIGNNVWIGGGSIILPGVVIGDNVVVGAGSVITKDIPSDHLAFGNPCRIIREMKGLNR